MKKKKNRFWLFVFSLLPGAGHMYMGFMKMGLSFMLGFMLMIGVIGITNISVFLVFAITLYIYSFFHANNIGGLDDEAFTALEDEYLFGIGEWDCSRFKIKLDRKSRNIAAVVCIVLGVSMLWNVAFGMLRNYVGWDNPYIRAVYYFMRNELPRAVIALAIIWFGVLLLRGKKADIVEPEKVEEKEEPVRWSGQVEQIEQRDDTKGGE